MAIRATTVTASTTATERSAWVSVLRRTVLLIPGLFLGLLAVKHFADGRAVDAAVPVPTYMIAHINMPKAAYVDAAAVLASANPRNGSASLVRGEAKMQAGESPAYVIPALEEGLSATPASARGWTLLAENVAKSDRHKAAQILAQALVLAPRDYWLAGMRARDASMLWSDLDSDTRRLAISQARLLWHEELLRPQLLSLADTTEGAMLLTRSFAPDEIRTINRWLAVERNRKQ